MILPDPSPDTQPFWSAAAEHRFVLRHCPACDDWLHPQLGFCPCGSPSLEWREASGAATLVSYTVVRRVPVPALAEDVPYTVVLVRTREGPQLVSALPGDGHALRCGMPLEVAFADVGEDITLVRFVPAGGA